METVRALSQPERFILVIVELWYAGAARRYGVDLKVLEAGGYSQLATQQAQIDQCKQWGAEAILLGSSTTSFPDLQKQVASRTEGADKMENRHSSEINRVDRSYRQKIAEYDNRLELIDTYFPIVKELIPIAEQCREVGFTEELTIRIVSLQPVEFKGRLYSKEYKEKFRTEHSTATVERPPRRKENSGCALTEYPYSIGSGRNFRKLKKS